MRAAAVRAPERPPKVPANAVWLPPASTTIKLAKMIEGRKNKRAYLRVRFCFADGLCTVWGPVREVSGPQAVCVQAGGRGDFVHYLFTRRTTETPLPVPGMWVWTIDDERSET